MKRMPVNKLARRYVLAQLLEQELDDFDRAGRGPEWAAVRKALADALGYLNISIDAGEDGLAAHLGAAAPDTSSSELLTLSSSENGAMQ